jgi:hypothetical protein
LQHLIACLAGAINPVATFEADDWRVFTIERGIAPDQAGVLVGVGVVGRHHRLQAVLDKEAAPALHQFTKSKIGDPGLLAAIG